MNIRSLTTLLFLLVMSFATAQDVKQTIAEEFTDYQDAIINGEFEKSMKYITPEFFEIFPKDQLINLMEQTFNNPEITFEIKDTNIENIGDLEEIEGKHYSLLTYSNQMNMRFNGEEDETEEQKQSRIGMTRVSLENTFGSQNVGYNPSTDFFEVKARKNVYAISVDGKTNWKFLVVEKGQKVILDQLLPKVLADKI